MAHALCAMHYTLLFVVHPIYWVPEALIKQRILCKIFLNRNWNNITKYIRLKFSEIVDHKIHLIIIKYTVLMSISFKTGDSLLTEMKKKM